MVEGEDSQPSGKPVKGTSFLSRTKTGIANRFARIGTRVRTTDFNLVGKGLGKAIVEPKFIRKDFFDVPRTAQWMAALLLPIIIIVTLAIVEAANLAFQQVLLNGGDLGEQSGIFAFLTTFIGLLLFILGAWGWFLWVRTGGFKLFDH